MSLEFPKGAVVSHKTNPNILFIVINSEVNYRIQCRRVDTNGNVQLETFKREELKRHDA